jgi:hypothetical protein
MHKKLPGLPGSEVLRLKLARGRRYDIRAMIGLVNGRIAISLLHPLELVLMLFPALG